MPAPGTLVFYFLAALAIVNAGMVAFSRNILHAALGLLVTLLAVAGLYLWLGADFLGVTQLLIYVGGILVMILFAVLFTTRIGQVRISNTSTPRSLAVVVAGAVAAGLAAVGITTPWRLTEAVAAPTTARLGDGFLREYLLPFELGGLVLLLALVGAMVLARRSIVPGRTAGTARGAAMGGLPGKEPLSS